MNVVVIGAGPAGVMAALRATELGADTTLVTRGEFGGIGVTDGPVPVRTPDAGLTGFGAWQVTDQRGSPGEVEPGRYHSYGVGPEAHLSLNERPTLGVRAQWEFGARNVLSGDNLRIILRHHRPAATP